MSARIIPVFAASMVGSLIATLVSFSASGAAASTPSLFHSPHTASPNQPHLAPQNGAQQSCDANFGSGKLAGEVEVVVQGGGALPIGDEAGQVGVEYLFLPNDSGAAVPLSASTWNDVAGHALFLNDVNGPNPRPSNPSVFALSSTTNSAVHSASSGMWHNSSFSPGLGGTRTLTVNATAPSGYRIVSVSPATLPCPAVNHSEIYGRTQRADLFPSYSQNSFTAEVDFLVGLMSPVFVGAPGLLDDVIDEFKVACPAEQMVVTSATLSAAVTAANVYVGFSDTGTNDCLLAQSLISRVASWRLHFYDFWEWQPKVTITVARDVPLVVEPVVPVVAPPLAAPAPVPNQSGALPTMTPGQVVVLVNGQAVTAEVAATATTLTVIGDGYTLGLAGDCTTGGCQITTDPTGRQTLALDTEGRVRTTGTGFLPGSIVHVWLFSAPTYLGPVTVAADGTFAAAFPLPAIAAGTHTVQVNGISADGIGRSANLGVLVEAPAQPGAPTEPTAPELPATELPATGTTPLTKLAILLAVLGGVLALGARRSYIGGR